MNWKAFMIAVIITTILSVFAVVCLSGCAGTGFEKRATLMPDSVGVTFGQSRYREEDAAYRGFMINLNWDLK